MWEVPSSEVETDAHPTSKACKLFTLPMEMHTEPGDLCYEPFSGSGSQLVAAQPLLRARMARSVDHQITKCSLPETTVHQIGMNGLKPAGRPLRAARIPLPH